MTLHDTTRTTLTRLSGSEDTLVDEILDRLSTASDEEGRAVYIRVNGPNVSVHILLKKYLTDDGGEVIKRHHVIEEPDGVTEFYPPETVSRHDALLFTGELISTTWEEYQMTTIHIEPISLERLPSQLVASSGAAAASPDEESSNNLSSQT